jgi:hypothetical protein
MLTITVIILREKFDLLSLSPCLRISSESKTSDLIFHSISRGGSAHSGVYWNGDGLDLLVAANAVVRSYGKGSLASWNDPLQMNQLI